MNDMVLLLDAGGSGLCGNIMQTSVLNPPLSSAQLGGLLLFLVLKEPGLLFAWLAKREPSTFIHEFTEKFMRCLKKKKN